HRCAGVESGRVPAGTGPRRRPASARSEVRLHRCPRLVDDTRGHRRGGRGTGRPGPGGAGRSVLCTGTPGQRSPVVAALIHVLSATTGASAGRQEELCFETGWQCFSHRRSSYRNMTNGRGSWGGETEAPGHAHRYGEQQAAVGG